MNTQSPYEQIKFIRDVIKDRTDKSQATFFSVKLESFGNVTPLVEKENGSLFYDTLIQYLTRYDVAAIIVELYHGKSHNIKQPFQSFRIILKKSPNISLAGIEKNDNIQIIQDESKISPEKHFQTLAESNFNILRLQYENDVLRKKNKKKKQRIEELEKELAKAEREKTGGLGNIALGSIASNALENFSKSNFGVAILKNVFGAKDEVIQGLLGNTSDSTQGSEPSSQASIVKEEEKPLTETEKIRKQIIDFITDFLRNADDGVLRLYYELFKTVGTDVKLLQSLFLTAKQYRAKFHSEKAETGLSVNETTNQNEEGKPGFNDSS